MPKILKSYGTQGAVAISRGAGITEEWNLSEPVTLLIDGLPVPFFIEEIRLKGGRLIVKFEDVDTLEEAEELVGLPFIPASAAEEAEEAPSLAGMIVHDEEGREIGPVTDWYDIPGNPCIEVLYKGRNLLLPLHEDLLRGVQGGIIRLAVPDGLLEE